MRLIPSVARVALVLLLVAGCGDSSEPAGPNDAGLPDAGRVDAGADDAGVPDAGGDDAGAPDAGDDAGTQDSGTPDAGPAETVILFDPRGAVPVIPEPNDLHIHPDTGRVSLPVKPGDTPAQREFTRDYLNTLDGFLESSAATALASAKLDPPTVNADTVRVLRADGAEVSETFRVAVDMDGERLHVTPQNGWRRGTQYVVAVLGGSSGVKDTEGRPVTGSAVWQWVRSSTPLVDGSGHSTVEGLPEEDARLLEPLRVKYAPFLERLESQGIRRADIAALWTFTTTARSRVSFAPERGVVPFPSHYFMSGDGSRVRIPVPAQGSGPLLTQALTGLNTLDGFSTTGVIASENSPAEGALDRGAVAPASLASGTRFLRMTGSGQELSVEACLDCTSSLRPDGTPPSSPQQLQFVPRLPLDEGTTYVAAVTTGLQDTEGRSVAATPVWALMRLSVPLVDGQGRSQVPGITDVFAQTLEPARQSLKPALDVLESIGLPRAQVALAFTVRTQTTLRELGSLAAYVRREPAAEVEVLDRSHQIPGLGVPNDELGGLYDVWVPIINLLSVPGGVIDRNQPRYEQVQVLLTLPSGPMPVSGWPVVLFAHDLTGDRTHLLHIANELARAGFAAAAMDAVRHGERSHCVGSSAMGQDDNACADVSAQRCETDVRSESHGRCVARDAASRVDCTQPSSGLSGNPLCTSLGLGRCVSSGQGDGRRVCEGGSFRSESGSGGVPSISGWNMFNPTAPFATRDNYRQAALDLEQLVRVVRSDTLAAKLGSGKLDGTRLHFVGLGMGAQVGSLFLAVNDDVQRAVLNVPAADPMGLLLTSPDFASRRSAYFSALEAEGIVRGTPAFDAFIQYQRQMLDPADAWNAARVVKEHTGVSSWRAVLIQYIAGDTFMPTPLTEKFIAAANAGNENRCPVSRWDPAGMPAAARHAFLLNRSVSAEVTDAAQHQAAAFLESGTVTAPPAGLR